MRDNNAWLQEGISVCEWYGITCGGDDENSRRRHACHECLPLLHHWVNTSGDRCSDSGDSGGCGDRVLYGRRKGGGGSGRVTSLSMKNNNYKVTLTLSLTQTRTRTLTPIGGKSS